MPSSAADSPPGHGSISPKALIWSYSLLSACFAAGYGVLFTVVGDYRDEYGISGSAIGWIIGVGFIAGFLAQIAFAPLGDRGHARKVVLVSVIVNALGLVLMGIGDDVGTIMAGRIVTGLASGAAHPSIRRIVVMSAPEQLGRNLGRLISADVFGFALGPAISAVLVGPFGLAAPFFVIAGASLVAVTATFSVQVQESATTGKRQLLALDLLRIRPLLGAIALGAAVFLMIGAFDTLWDLVHEDLGTATWVANLGITLFAVPLVILGPIGGSFAQEVGPFPVASVGLMAGAAFMMSYGLLPSGSWIFSVAMGHAVADGLTIASTGVAIALAAPDDRQAEAQGLLGAAQALTAGITAVVTGALYQTSGRALAYGTAAGAMVIVVVIGMVLAAPAWRLGRRQSNRARIT